MAVGERDQRAPPGFVRHRALRIGGRADIGQRDAIEQVVGQRGEIRQKAGRGRGGHGDGFGADGERGGAVALIEGVRHEYRRALPMLGFRREREGGVEKTFAAAVERDHFRFGIDRDPVAQRQPVRDRGAKLRRALVGWVAAEIRGMRGDGRGDEGGNGVPRLADGHGKLRSAGRAAVEKPPQTRKDILRQIGEPLG